MKKSTFYFICEHIHPSQVQSLVLSDDQHTPGQIELFTSLFLLDQFINLQSITIFQIQDVTLLYKILSRLENHVRIQSLAVDGHPIKMNKKSCRSITEILTTLSSLKYLTFMDSSPLTTLHEPLSKLTHLTISSCTLNDLRIVFQWLPNLLHLHISLPYNDHRLTFDYIPPHLTSLIINSSVWMLFNELEAFFSRTPLLERLVLETLGEQESS